MRSFHSCALIVFAITAAASAGDRFVITVGTVKREVSADRAAMTLDLTARGETIDASNQKLEQMLRDFHGQLATLRYPTNAASLRYRSVSKATQYDEQTKKWTPAGFDASAAVSVTLIGLANYSSFLTYLGTNDGIRITWRSMGSSDEGQVRKEAIVEALRAARAKAELLAEEGKARIGKVIEIVEEPGPDADETRELPGSTWGGNSQDPNEGSGAYPIGVFTRVRAKFELNAR